MDLNHETSYSSWNRLLLNQPANPITGLKAYDLEKLSENKFLYFEQTYLTYTIGYQTKSDVFYVLEKIPNTIYSSDLGQTTQIDIMQWISLSEEIFIKAKVSLQRKKEITIKNPLKLLSI